MKLKLFQKQDLARAALHDGLILSWDTGLGKTWAIFLWLLLKVGYTEHEILGLNGYLKPKASKRAFAPNAKRLRPKAPVLIIAPGDLHQQIVDEAWERFGIAIYPLDCQTTFERLCRNLHSAKSITDEQGRPVVPADFYITSYSQLTTNGVERLPDAFDWPNPISLRQLLCLKDGDHIPTSNVAQFCLEKNQHRAHWDRHPDFESTCHFWAWRGVKWADAYHKFDLDPETGTRALLDAAYDREEERLAELRDPQYAAKEREKLLAAYETMKMLVTKKPDPHYADLATDQQMFVLREFCAERLAVYADGEGHVQTREQLSDGTWRTPPVRDREGNLPAVAADAPTVARTWSIKCVYSPSLSDLCYNAFRGVAIDEGVKMKGADTYVGLGVRQMDPEFRLVLTATPIKNRAPDIFWLAHWATGGKTEAHARFPYPGTNESQTKFAERFMVSEENLTKKGDEKSARASSGRYKKLTAEVCNIHRLWKMLGPIVLRRRKDECGEDIVPKIRKVIRCQMGTLQADAYQYHLDCDYTDINGDEAIGARLQALRMAAADPSSSHLREQLGEPTKKCVCTQKPVPAEEQLKRLQARRKDEMERWTSLPNMMANNHKKPKELREHQNLIAAIDAEIAKPILRFDTVAARKGCPHCQGEGELRLPHRSGAPYIPKHASVLALIQEIMARGEQVVVGAAFNDPLDHLSNWLDEAGVRHLKLDGRTSQKKRGAHASVFKRGRTHHGGEKAIPVMLAGVECMAEGHSFHLANNVILLAYSWAYDKFIQFINRVHRMTSPHPVNVYVVVCDGTIDGRLEGLIGEKGDSSELVLDGRLIGERSEEVNLAELLKVAHQEFNSANNTLDEALIHAQWPALREQLRAAMGEWDRHAHVVEVTATVEPTRKLTTKRPAPPESPRPAVAMTQSLRYDPASKKYITVTIEPVATLPPPPPPKAAKPGATTWQDALRPKRAKAMVLAASNPWDAL